MILLIFTMDKGKTYTILNMIKNNLSALMGAKRLKIADVVRMSGLSYETVFKLFHEKSKGIEFETLNKLCWALECTPNEIFTYIAE